MYRIKNAQNDVLLLGFKKYDFANKILSGTSLGIDFGVIYHFNSRCNFGLMITDICNSGVEYKNFGLNSNKPHPASGYSARINPEIILGTAYYPEKLYYWPGKYFETNIQTCFSV